MVKGVFVTKEEDEKTGRFGIHPTGKDDDLPENQVALQKALYLTQGTVRILCKDADEKKEYLVRLKQIADSGLVGSKAHPNLASRALVQIRKELMSRKGRPVKVRYFVNLMISSAILALIAALVWYFSDTDIVPDILAHFAALGIGAMIGLNLSFGALRTEVDLEELPMLMDLREAPIRAIYVALLAAALGAFIHSGVIEVGVLGFTTDGFGQSFSTAIVLGLITGIGEKTLSLSLTQRAIGLAETLIPSGDGKS